MRNRNGEHNKVEAAVHRGLVVGLVGFPGITIICLGFFFFKQKTAYEMLM